jgi:hypothetical protein
VPPQDKSSSVFWFKQLAKRFIGVRMSIQNLPTELFRCCCCCVFCCWLPFSSGGSDRTQPTFCLPLCTITSSWLVDF